MGLAFVVWLTTLISFNCFEQEELNTTNKAAVGKSLKMKNTLKPFSFHGFPTSGKLAKE